jgi:hypothetical protein
MRSPVAEANSSSKTLLFAGLQNSMPSTLREIQKPGLPHCSRRFLSYTTKRSEVQGGVDGDGPSASLGTGCSDELKMNPRISSRATRTW